MSVKGKIDSAIKRAAEDMAAEQPQAQPEVGGEDAVLERALARVERGELVAARRTKNGTLLETH